MTSTDIKYFAKARQVALLSDYSKTHVGCIAIYHGRVIAIGCNTNKTHPTQEYYNRFRNIEGVITKPILPKLHAEINCINQLKHVDVNFSKVKLYIYRQRLDQSYGIARPCASCMAAIYGLGIRNIYYTTNFGFAHEKIENYMKEVLLNV